MLITSTRKIEVNKVDFGLWCYVIGLATGLFAQLVIDLVARYS